MTALVRIALASSAALSLLLAQPARAYSSGDPGAGRPLGFLLRMGFDFGGDKLVEVRWDNGDKGTLRAGQLISFGAGFLYHPNAPWALEGTIGYKFDKVNGSNGTIEFTRFPLDLVVAWAARGHRLGAGPTVHLSPKYRCDATGLCDQTVSFDTAVGGILQYAYGFRLGASAGLDAGLRYTFVDYEASAGPGSIDGSGFGFFFGGWF